VGFEILNSNVAEVSGLLGCDGVFLGEWFLLFWRIVAS